MKDEHSNLFWFAVGVLVVGLWLFGTKAKAQEAGDYPGCFGWIPHQCSCTSNSCYEARRGELTDLGNETYRVNRTGEIVGRTAWSKDGRFMLCAFRRDQELNQWITGPGQPIKCVFPPIPAS
jgi:hypothetical protein